MLVPPEIMGLNKLIKTSPLVRSIQYSYGVFGGAVRSWITGRKPRDIDIAINCERFQLEELLEDFKSEQNRFGGFKLNENGVIFDMWPLNETWALKNAQVDFTFDNLARYASYNLDCIVLTDSLETIDIGYSKAMKEGFVEVNYEPNPIAMYNALRGLRLCKVYNLKAGQSLKDYVVKYVDTDTKKFIVEKKYRDQYGEDPRTLWELVK
jgi:hypothetical protein